MKVSVIGCGTMGNGIAQVFAQCGNDVNLIDVKQEFLDRAMGTIEKNLGRLVTQLHTTDVRYIPYHELAQPPEHGGLRHHVPVVAHHGPHLAVPPRRVGQGVADQGVAGGAARCVRAGPVEAAFSHEGKYAWITQYYMIGPGFKRHRIPAFFPLDNPEQQMVAWLRVQQA